MVAPPSALRISAYTYDARTKRYRNVRTGRLVSTAEVRRTLDRTLQSIEQDVRRRAEAVVEGSISLRQFQLGMEADVKSIHLLSYTLEKGGWSQMTAADYGRVGRTLYNPNATTDRSTWGQYQFLRGFIEETATGRQRIDRTFIRRAGMYAQAGRKTYHRAELIEMLARGATQARRNLNPADHCTDADGELRGCVELAAEGWVPIENLTPIGDANCRTNCKCDVSYRNPATGETFNA